MKKKKAKKPYYVHLQFEAFGVHVKAISEAEAKRIAFERTIKKSYRTLIDHRNTSADKDFAL